MVMKLNERLGLESQEEDWKLDRNIPVASVSMRIGMNLKKRIERAPNVMRLLGISTSVNLKKRIESVSTTAGIIYAAYASESQEEDWKIIPRRGWKEDLDKLFESQEEDWKSMDPSTEPLSTSMESQEEDWKKRLE